MYQSITLQTLKLEFSILNIYPANSYMHPDSHTADADSLKNVHGIKTPNIKPQTL
jgi:hypothetical protein